MSYVGAILYSRPPAGNFRMYSSRYFIQLQTKWQLYTNTTTGLDIQSTVTVHTLLAYFVPCLVILLTAH
jgi:hypothetical protein